MEYMLQDPPTTINGKKQARKKLGVAVGKKVIKKMSKFAPFEFPNLDIILAGLSCVWKWPEAQKPAFWAVFFDLVRNLREFWEQHPPKEKTTSTIKPWTWDCATWYA